MSEPGKSTTTGLQVTVMQSELGRVRGLGSARSGVHHWWAERWTSLALVPLTLWFVANVVRLSGAPHQAVLDWMYSPYTVVLMLALIAMTFYHMALGLQVVVEDYIHHEGTRFAMLLLIKAAASLLGLAAAVSVLKMGL